MPEGEGNQEGEGEEGTEKKGKAKPKPAKKKKSAEAAEEGAQEDAEAEGDGDGEEDEDEEKFPYKYLKLAMATAEEALHRCVLIEKGGDMLAGIVLNFAGEKDKAVEFNVPEKLGKKIQMFFMGRVTLFPSVHTVSLFDYAGYTFYLDGSAGTPLVVPRLGFKTANYI